MRPLHVRADARFPSLDPRLFFSLLALGCMVLAGRIVAADEKAPVVHNPATPTAGTAQLVLRPLWTVGGEDGELLLGDIVAITEDSEGQVYLLDNQLSEIQAISPEGEWIGSLGREGEAPGEFRNPRDLFVMPGGNLAVVQTMPAKVALLTPEGDPLDDHRLPDANEGLRMLMGGRATDDRIVLVSSAFIMQEGEMGQQTLLYAVDAEGKELAQYEEALGGVDFATYSVGEEQLDNFSRYWTLDGRGRVVVAPHYSDYRLNVYAADGTLEHTIVREHTPRARTEKEKEQITRNYQMNINGRDIEVIPQEVPRTIHGVYARADGGIWVMLRDRDADMEAGRIARFDEFDAEGHYRRQLTLTGPVDPRTDRLFVEGDRMYVVHDARSLPEDEEEAEEDVAFARVTAYAIEPVDGSGR